MKDDQKLGQQLNRPEVPADLEQKLRANWLEQQSRRHSATRFGHWPLVAGVALMLGVGVMLSRWTVSDDLISVALADIQADRQKQVGVVIPVGSVLAEVNVKLPPQTMPVQMAKYCNLNGQQAVHMQVAGVRQGAVHLFIRKGEFDRQGMPVQDLQSAVMPWRLIKPQADLSVLVMYTKDMNPRSVERLIQSMFYT